MSTLATFAPSAAGESRWAGRPWPSPGTSSSHEADLLLVQQAKVEIRTLVREITQLAQSDISLEEFYAGFLSRVVSALAAVGGAIWTPDDAGVLRLRQHVNLSETRLALDPAAAGRHARLLQASAAAGQPVLVAPEAAEAGDARPGNPTAFLLVLGTLRSLDGMPGLVEIFQRPGGSPVTQRGYLRFVVQMCALADDFLRNRQLRQLQRRAAAWQRTREFVHAVQRQLDLRAVTYAVANEGRQLIEADRVSVLVPHGRGLTLMAVSGLDGIDRRAELCVRLRKLAEAVCRFGEPFWYPSADMELPPQVDAVLQPYLDAAHARSVAVIPLSGPGATAEQEDTPTAGPIGCLVVERFSTGLCDDEFRRRVATVAGHGGTAVSHALEHERLFLFPVWRALGKAWSAVGGRWRTRALAAAIVVVAAALALALVPAPLRIGATGTLEPVAQQYVFAQVDGTIVDVPVTHGQTVEAGMVLARMRNTELELQLTEAVGRQATAAQELRSLQQALLKQTKLPEEERTRLSARLPQLKESVESLDREVALLRSQAEQLVVRSPRSGQVATWQVQELLCAAPSGRGSD